MVRLNAMNLGVNALIVFLSALTKNSTISISPMSHIPADD